MAETITRREPAAEEHLRAVGRIRPGLTVLVAGAFVADRHFGRRWDHVTGW